MYLRRCYPVCTVCLAYFVMYGRVWRRSRKHIDARAIHISNPYHLDVGLSHSQPWKANSLLGF